MILEIQLNAPLSRQEGANNACDSLQGFVELVQQQPTLESVRVRVVGSDCVQFLEVAREIREYCGQTGKVFSVDVLVDRVEGKGEVIQEILGFSQGVSAPGVELRWLVPIAHEVVFRLQRLFLLAGEAGALPLIVAPENRSATSDELLFVWDFLKYGLLESGNNSLSDGVRDYYEQMIIELESANFNPDSLELSSTLPEFHNFESAGVSKQGFSFGEVTDVLSVGTMAHFRSLLSGAAESIPHDGSQNQQFENVLLIGAYGGEHIGDIAILGGVLFRMHRQFGTRKATLLTQRPAHTRHLTPMLDTPVTLDVDVYEPNEIRRYLAEADCVVFAGGPLIDLPKQLVRHLYTVSLARSQGKPFIAEGIGPGPFVRGASRFTARRLMQRASRISLRSADGVGHAAIEGLEYEVSRCPAFDYLETRGDDLTRLPSREPQEIGALLEGVSDRPVIAVNVRPIGHFYTVGADGEDLATYTRSVEATFEKHFADGLTAYSDRATIKPCFVFFPMNAIQFGMCDLLSAYRIQKHLGDAVDFRIWEADASLDGVVALLRKADTAITMRFHATIFALSQQCKVIGIDYRVGKKDKIAGLMEDAGLPELCTRIDLMTGDWLSDRLQDLS